MKRINCRGRDRKGRIATGTDCCCSGRNGDARSRDRARARRWSCARRRSWSRGRSRRGSYARCRSGSWCRRRTRRPRWDRVNLRDKRIGIARAGVDPNRNRGNIRVCRFGNSLIIAEHVALGRDRRERCIARNGTDANVRFTSRAAVKRLRVVEIDQHIGRRVVAMIVKDAGQNLTVGGNVNRGIKSAEAGRIIADRFRGAPGVAAIGRFGESDPRIAGQNGLVNQINISMSWICDRRWKKSTAADDRFVILIRVGDEFWCSERRSAVS